MKIAVLMSTYNGEKYLNQQIESILSQNLRDDCELTLFIRDDGSVDQTCKIINYYVKSHGNIIHVSAHDSSHLGIKKSFLFVLKTAVEQGEGFDYYAFSDQDDVWLEDKLMSAIDRLEKSKNTKGALYYSNKLIVDENLHIKEIEHICYYGDFIEILNGSLAFGNTMVFDNNLARYANFHHSKVANYHDAWVYRLAKCIGSDIFFDESAHICYRQHSGNVVGYVHGIHKSWPYMIINFIPNLIKPREHFIQNQIGEICKFYQDELDPKAKRDIHFVMDYNKNFKSKFALLKDPDMKKRPVLDRCIWAYKVLFNMF